MAQSKVYSIAADTANNKLDAALLQDEFLADVIVFDKIDGVNRDQGSDSFEVFLIVTITPTIEAAMDAVVNAHTGIRPVDPVDPTEINITGGQPCLTPTGTRIELSFTKVDLPRSTEAYASIYNYSGTGKFHGFCMNFNSERVKLKLTIDGNEIFDIDCEDLEDNFSMSNNSSSGGGGSSGKDGCWVQWNKSGNGFKFNPRYGIGFTSSVLIEARANYNNSGRDMKAYMIDIEKDS